MNMASQITQYEWATIDQANSGLDWDTIFWQPVESKVSKLQSRIAKAMKTII